MNRIEEIYVPRTEKISAGRLLPQTARTQRQPTANLAGGTSRVTPSPRTPRGDSGMAEGHSTGAETRACAGKLCAGTTSRFGRADRTAGYPPRAIDLAGSGRRAKVRGGAEARRLILNRARLTSPGAKQAGRRGEEEGRTGAVEPLQIADSL